MIHQHIFAAPKPGMSPEDFKTYWLEVHAPRFASKISQIKRYKLALRIPSAIDPAPIWHGLAEIWLRDESEQIASLQSSEFLEGARLDEPRWAAFWATVVLDCSSERRLGPAFLPRDAVKLLVLQRRAHGLAPSAYRDLLRLRLDAAVRQVPSLLAFDLAFAREALYRVGEPPFDAVAHYWFEDRASAERLIGSGAAEVLLLRDDDVVNPKQLFPMLLQEHWIVGPQARP